MQECEACGAVRRLKHQRPTSHEVGMRENLTRTSCNDKTSIRVLVS